jgi:protein-S-isoprenylcysteine O-methyltransferase Ste14
MTNELALLIYFLTYFGSAFVWKSWVNYKQTGVNPVVLPNSDDAYGYVAKGFKLVMIALFVFCIINLFLPSLRAFFGTFTLPFSEGFCAVGWGLMLAALFVTLKSQNDMKTAWRIGIDTQVKTDLMTSGLFKFSRNPIFLSMRTSLLGLFLVSPSTITALFACLGEVFMQIQVRLEEVHLLGLHGEKYTQYQQRTRRWL